MKFALAKVNKALGSVSQMCKSGHRVVMDLITEDGSFVEDLTTGERVPIYLENDVFVMDIWVKPPTGGSAAPGFAWQEA